MKAVILWDVEKTTALFDGLLEKLPIEIQDRMTLEDVIKWEVDVDLIFLCDVDPQVALEIKRVQKANVFTLSSSTVALRSLSELINSITTRVQKIFISKLEEKQQTTVYHHHACRLDGWRLYYPNGYVWLTKKESMLLALLLENAGKVMDRITLASFLWETLEQDFRNVDSLIKKIRQKITPANEWLEIETFYKYGYSIKVGIEAIKALPDNLQKDDILYVPGRGQFFVKEICIVEQPLTKSEAIILWLLLQNQGHIQSRDAIIRHLDPHGDLELDDRNIDSHIKRLREKLWKWKDIIKTIYGGGYMVDGDAIKKKIWAISS